MFRSRSSLRSFKTWQPTAHHRSSFFSTLNFGQLVPTESSGFDCCLAVSAERLPGKPVVRYLYGFVPRFAASSG